MTRTNHNRVFLLSASPSEDDSKSLLERKSKEIQKEAQERSPIRLFAEDVFLLFTNLALFPYVLLPLKKAVPLPGTKKRTARVAYGWTVLILLALIEGPLLIASGPAFFLLPGWIFSAAALACFLVIFSLAWTTWGGLVLESKTDAEQSKFPNERWLYINGITTSHAGLQQDIDNISATFGRPVTGIHNRSFGVPFDLIECLIQRSFAYHTSDVRVATASLTLALEDPAVTKIVVMAHSQGGLILSLVLDRLYSVLPASLFAKLEIYTFGSAANFFHNPLVKHFSARVDQDPEAIRRVAKAATDPPALITIADDDAIVDAIDARPEIPNQLIHTIEHYVNAWDLVPRWGVLYSILLGTASDYSGRVFVHDHASGHLFEEHYLSTMFPLAGLARIYDDDSEMFLNHKVHLEDRKGGRPRWGMFRASTEVAERPVNGTTPTVRQMSRLWRYLGGGTA